MPLRTSTAPLRTGLVSIGLPVYNGQRYLREAIDSLLAQEYREFELIISDNASTDATESICRSYAAQDARVRYYREAQNRGAVWNFLRVYELAQGEFFMWAAHDDRHDPRRVRRCVEELRANPAAGCCVTGVRIINEQGSPVTQGYYAKLMRPVGALPRHRLRAIADATTWLDIYSLFRTPVIAGTKMGEAVWGNDVVTVAEVALRAPVAEAPEPLFEYRYFAAKTAEDQAANLSITEGPGSGSGSASAASAGSADGAKGASANSGAATGAAAAGAQGAVQSAVAPAPPPPPAPPSYYHFAAEMFDAVRRAPLPLRDKPRLYGLLLLHFCIKNPTMDKCLGEEGLTHWRYCLTHRRYRRAAIMLTLWTALQPVYICRFFARLPRRIASLARRPAGVLAPAR